MLVSFTSPDAQIELTELTAIVKTVIELKDVTAIPREAFLICHNTKFLVVITSFCDHFTKLVDHLP
jgi:hypothetical protein